MKVPAAVRALVLVAAACWSAESAAQAAAPVEPGSHYLEVSINGVTQQRRGLGVENMLNDEGRIVSGFGATWSGIANAWTFGGSFPRAESFARTWAEGTEIPGSDSFTSVSGGVGSHSILTYYSRIVELEAPPYAVPEGSLPYRLPVSVSYYGEATAMASGSGSSAYGSARANIGGFEVVPVTATETCRSSGSCDGTGSVISTGTLDFSFLAGLQIGVVLESWAGSYAFAGGTSANGSARGRAYFDPAFSFNQGAFDAMALAEGFATFDLSRYYAFEFSEGVLPGPVLAPVPEPETLVLLAAGLALLTCRRMRAARGQESPRAPIF